MAKRKQKVEIKIVENGKPEILFLPLSIGTKILRKIAANEHDQLGDTTTLADPSVVESLVENRKNK